MNEENKSYSTDEHEEKLRDEEEAIERCHYCGEEKDQNLSRCPYH